jgi:homoserine O-acetyltransferase
MTAIDYELHPFDATPLLGGQVLDRPLIAFKTHGVLSKARDNAILFPTWFGSTHVQNNWLIGPGRALDPAGYFIVCVDLLGNGLSSSPSNTPAPQDGPRFPEIHVLDNASESTGLN